MSDEEHKKIIVDIIEPERLVYRVEGAESLIVEAVDGELAFLPGHTSLLTDLRVGRCVSRKGRTEKIFSVSGGLLEARDDRVRIFTRAAESNEDIDRERAERARDRAERRLRERREGIDVPRARAALSRAVNRLRVSEIPTRSRPAF